MSTTDVVRITSQQSSKNEKDQGKLKADPQCHKRRGVLKAPSESSYQGRRCARCRAPFGRIYNIGASCPRCGHRVCQQCRESRASNDKGTVAVEWLCAVCHKVTELHGVSGEWMCEASASKRAARRKNSPSPIDILKRSIRRSWTINGPPTRWSVTRRSPELRIYRSLPARREDYRQVAQIDSKELSLLRISNVLDADGRDEGSVGLTEIEARLEENLCGSETKFRSRLDLNERTNSKQNENLIPRKDEEALSSDIVKARKSDKYIVKTDGAPEAVAVQEQASPRVSLIKPPRVLPRLGTPADIKSIVKHGERKSSIPVFRRSSKEFEDIKSPQESAKRSLIPQRYRGSTDDLRRSREDISVPSLIPKLFSPKNKEDRLKRQDSRDEIRHIPKAASRRDVIKDSKEEPRILSCQANGRDDCKTGIRIFRRDSREDVGRESTSIGRIKYSNKEERQERTDGCVGEESRSRSGTSEQGKAGTRALKRESREEIEVKVVESKSSRSQEEVTLTEMANEQIKVEERIDGTEEKVTRESEVDETMNERKEDEERANLSKRENVEKEAEETGDVKDVENSIDVADGSDSNEADAGSLGTAKKRGSSFESSHGRRMEDFQEVRRKFSKEEFSNLDETDDIPNRRCSSHLSPEASPLSTRSSRYSPRESESEPTPALPRKIGSGDSCSASQRIRDAITRTRRESNSSTRYESSGSESVRLSEPGLHGYADLARRVKFCGSGSGTGSLAGGDEVVHRDSATSAGEDEPHDDNYSRDPRTGPASSQTRTMMRRRRQFDAQGSRRRGRSHARGCVDELQSLQTLHVIGRGGGRQPSPPGIQGQGQEAPIVDYRRLVFISSDSSSGREDDADSSSGSSSLNGLARGGNAQGLEDCDWDYFESGVIPLPSNITINTSNVGTDAVSQDWSCCPGRGSSACQACGGSRGANVLPVPVPIPVPVPYPVPVPAALWTGDFAAPSMIGCGPAAEGSLTLRGEPNAPWFAWHPRFSHAMHGAARIDPRLTAGAFDPVTFAFRPEIVNSRLPAGVDTATSNARESSTRPAHQERSNVNESVSTGSVQDASNEESKLNVSSSEVNVENQSGTARPASLVDDEIRSTKSVGDIDPAEQLGTENEQTAQNSLSSFACDQNRAQKMFRRGDSGSSSGRSSADSSDLEDSASHHFSRVFVVNDDSLTSDNDVEDNEDSDSAREGGVTFKRVSSLPEDEPVILRNVRLLDEDTNVGKVPRDKLNSNDLDGKERVRRSASLEDSAVVVVDNSTSDRDSCNDQNRTMDRFYPQASEIYLADSKDCSDSHIELKSVKILDPDSIESSSSSTTFYNADRHLLEEEYRFGGNEEGNDVVSFAIDRRGQVESNVLFPDGKNGETKGSNFVAHLGPSSIDFDSSIIIPDSLEVSELMINSALREGDAEDDEKEEDGSSNDESRILPSSDIYGGEIKLNPPAVNSDKTVIRADKPAALSAVSNGSLNSNGLESCKMMSDLNNEGNSNVSLTGESASSETNTGSEVSSDELHEYEVSTIESNECEFGVINKKLILSRNLDEEITSGFEEDIWNSTSRASHYEDSTSSFNPKESSSRNNENSVESVNDCGTTPIATTSLQTSDLSERDFSDDPKDTGVNVTSDGTKPPPRVSISVNDRQRPRARDTSDSLLEKTTMTESEERQESTNPDDPRWLDRNDDLVCRQDHSVGDIISSKIHEMFKNADNVRSATETAALARHDESGTTIGERPGPRQVGGGVRCVGGGSNGETERGTARFRSVERRPPTRKDGFLPGSTKDNSPSFPSNKYRSLVMITQGAYQPVSVVTSDTTTLLQPDEHQPPQGLAGYFQLALEAAAEPHRNGQGPRRPLMVKRVATPAQTQPETEADSGLSVGSASESDDVQSVKSVGSRIGQGASGAEHGVIKTCAGSQGVPAEQVSSQTSDSAVRGRLNSQQQQQLQQGDNGQGNSEIVILEEGLADDDSWVEEVSHDEEEQGATTATEESSEDEANNLGDREEELRGYHRQAIDFTLHTIVEESCEESEAEPSLAAGSPRKQRPPSASELEKYFFFGLGEGNVNLGSREVDSLSETSSIYSEGLESLGQEESTPSGDKTSAEFLNSSRLEKYFLSEFLGFAQDRRDSDGSVGSDSEGRPSPEQRRKRLVRARGTGRSHSSSLDNLLALAQSSQNLSSQNSLQDLSLNQDSQGTQSEGSSTETDGAEDQTPAFGTDGQFDTVKRKKKKPRNLGTQSPRVPEDRNKTPEPREIVEIGEGDPEMMNSEDERSKTPQPEGVLFSTSSLQVDVGRGGAQSSSSEASSVRTKQQSRDSGFVGSCDDLLQHQKTSGDGQTVGCQDSTKDSSQSEEGVGSKNEKNAAKIELSVGQSIVAPPPAASLSRKDSFNNWSSDEETNVMMSKMRQFFKTMVANSNGQNQNSTNNSSGASPAPSPRLSGNSPKLRLGSQNRTKPPQLVYFENELTRLMKTVPGIRDEQVREIVEYLSSEDTWSDSYDSSDYTSSDLEGAGGRRSALQEQISQSCQQIISKFDTTVTEPLSDREKEGGRSAAGTPQPLGRDTAFVYQKLVQSFTKMAGDGVSSDASSTPHSSPPLIAKVMHHIGSRLVALMHEVSEGGPAVQPPSWRRYPQHHRTPSSASTTEDDDSTSDSTNAPVHLQLPRSKSHDPLLLLNGHPTTTGQEGEEREASDYERFSWRGSFESALMAADSRTKLSLLACSGDVSASASASALAMAAKRRSAGDLLFNPKSFSREQLDRVRSCGSIGGGTGSTEEKIWSNRRRSSVPDANTRGESGASAGDDDTEDELEYGGDPRATTLPRGMQAAAAAAAAATNSLPRLPATASTTPGGGSMSMHKAHSVHHFLPQHTGVKSARYRPPGFARNSLGNATGTTGPKRAVSAPGLQVSGSQAVAGKRDNSRSRRQQAMSLTSDDGSSLSEACSTPIIGAGSRTGSNTVDDDMDRGLHPGHLATRASLSSLGARSDSMASVYSGAGEGRWCGSVAVRGEVEFALQYDYKQLTFEVHVTQCRDLAPVDIKRNRSDPYVKVYLLPDKSKSGKRKTKVKKHTLNPVFDETLKFHMSLNGLETRTLWLTVWHSDMFGRNDFLGEVRMPLENKIFDDPTPRWYSLQERTEPFDDPIAYKGEVIVGLKFVPPDPAQQQERERELGVDQRGASKTRKNWSRGALHVLVKEARNLQTRAKHSGTCDPFCKSYLLPDKGRSGKQKTGVVRRCSGGSPVWGHTFVYKDVSLQELAERGLELTVWDHDRIASNEFLGGVRFNLGTGKHYGKPVDWMDATGRELSLWQSMLERPNFWVEGAVTLRPNLHNHGKSTF